MRSLQVLSAAILVLGATRAEADDDDTPEQVVVVNAASKLGSVGQIARLRRVLDSRNMLVRLDKNLEATLDGRNVLIADVDAIREAYSSADYELALKIIDTDEERILGEAVSRDPIPALAELSQWRGIIAAALNQQDEALGWFRAAYRFNPAWHIDKRLASPRVRSLVKRAKREPDEMGTLRVNTDPEDARISIDGAGTRSAGEKLELPIGKHLVMITAPKRKPYAELVEIAQDETYRIDISLDDETTLDRAARLVDATAAAPAGKPRLKRARALAKLTGVPRLLVIEDGGEDHVLVRLYDVDLKKVSRPLELEGTAPSAAIARKIVAALDPDNLVDVNTIVLDRRGDLQKPKPWYTRWYVWAAVGAVAIGGYATYDYMSREPTAVRGF
ncbi:MAG TPA: PEGA domain-containing protein [Kofleriaceae bacterium]|nr:PEGA domain-containing protein [Kofleriaceae bacterium]